MDSSHASYEELMKQVLNLQMENTHLRRELLHSSSHLTRLETDSSSMKESLAGLQAVAGLEGLETADDGGGDLAPVDTYAERQSPPSTAGLSMPRSAFDQNFNSSSDELTEDIDNWVTVALPGVGIGVGTSPNNDGEHLGQRSDTTVHIDAARRSSRSPTGGTPTAGGISRKLVDAFQSVPAPGVASAIRDASVGRNCVEHETRRSVDNLRTTTADTPRDSFGGASCDNSTLSVNAGGAAKLVTIATQTADIFLPEPLSSLDLAAETLYADSNICAFYHGGWPVDRGVSSPSDENGLRATANNQDTASMLSFSSSTNATASSSSNYRVQQQLGTKVEMVYSLLSMLGTHDKDDMSQTLLAMSNSQDSCVAMRQSGCLPLLIQLLHGNGGQDGAGSLLGGTRGCRAARQRAARALRNIVCSNPDSRRSRREERVLRLLEQLRTYCDELRGEGRSGSQERDRDADKSTTTASPAGHDGNTADQDESDVQVGPATAALMKLSFDEEYRTAICTLGGLQAIAELLQLDDEANGSDTRDAYSITLRRYACMALTNLTYGDGANKALLCSLPVATKAIVLQLCSPDEDLRQVAASVLRNLSWRADPASKLALRETGTVTALTRAALTAAKESTLKSILSALWNVSAHCTNNKAAVCAVPGALEFFVAMLEFHSVSNSPSVAENAGGVLRNVSSYVAVHEEHRAALRRAGALPTLLRQLRSPSLTVVSNACGTLWNLSARCAEDQQTLRELGAVAMLRSLVNSKHRMIAMGSTAALKNLLAARPTTSAVISGAGGGVFENGNSVDRSASPGLHMRRQRGTVEGEIIAARHSDNNLAMSNSFDSTDALTAQRSVTNPTSFRRTDESSNSLEAVRDSVVAGNHSLTAAETGKDASWYLNVASQKTPSDAKMSRTNGGIAGQFAVGVDGNYYGSRSVDNSPAAHRRAPLRVGMPGTTGLSLESAQIERNLSCYAGAGGYGSWGGSSATKNVVPSNPATSAVTPSAAATVHLSRRMERIHLTDLNDGDQDEPINFSIKYNTESAEPSARSLVAAQRLRPQLPPNTGSPQPQAGVIRSQSCAIVPQQNFSRMMQPGFGKSQPAQQQFVMNAAAVSAAGRIVQPRFQRGGYMKPTSVDAEQPTDYSLQFAEQYDDETGGHFTEQPIDYSTRYMEPQNGVTVTYPRDSSNVGSGTNMTGVLRRPVASGPHVDESSSFCEDTVKTFCTEGTPMNYLSTATSMNDLSGGGKTGVADRRDFQSHSVRPIHDDLDVDEVQDFSRKYSEEPEMEDNQGNRNDSGRSRPATDFVSSARPSGTSNMASAYSVDRWAGPPQHVTAAYSYKDGTMSENGILSPGEQPRTFCTEGTPPNFSHASSLSSLHSGDVAKSGLNDGMPRNFANSASAASSTAKQMENPGSSFMMSRANPYVTMAVGIRPQIATSHNLAKENLPTGGSCGTDAAAPHAATAAGKTVTFDVESNQVQETPLMFSRCSSLGSLSSFDIHSVHSSVVSEYSVRASQVVSPSELPDSPGDTMPPSPATRRAMAPTFFGGQKPEATVEDGKASAEGGAVSTNGGGEADVTARSGDSIQTAILAESSRSKGLHENSVQPPLCDKNFDISDQSSPIHYCDEDDHLSVRTSFSALTCDGEKIGVCREPRTLPLGEESNGDKMQSDNDNKVGPSSSEKIAEEPAEGEEEVENGSDDHTKDSLDDDDDDDSPVSEGEENLLAECITLAMPTKSASRSMVRSRSDGVAIGQKAGNGSSLSTVAQRSTYSNKLTNSPSVGFVPTREQQKMQQQQQQQRPILMRTPAAAASSFHPVVGAMQPAAQPQPRAVVADISDGFDSPRKFATEDTPLNYSQTGSLSDLSMTGSDYNNTTVLFREPTAVSLQPTVSNHSGVMDNSGTGKQVEKDDDEVSLSDEDIPDGDELLSQVIEAAMPKKNSKSAAMVPQAVSKVLRVAQSALPTSNQPRRPVARSLEPPVPRVQTSNAAAIPQTAEVFTENHSTQPPVPRSNAAVDDEKSAIQLSGSKSFTVIRSSSDVQNLPKITSEPVANWMAARSYEFAPAEDHLVSYACEGTPVSCSRDLSPSGGARARGPASNAARSKSERSWNSSLSSLSFDSSLNAEPTATENALLEECINAAMPKSRGKKAYRKLAGEDEQRRHHQVLRTSPSGSSESSLKRQPPNMALTKSPKLTDGAVKTQDVMRFSANNKVIAKEPVHEQSDHSDASYTNSGNTPGAVDSVSSVADIMKESLPDVGAFSDGGLDDDTLPSGPSTEANNTVIYLGPTVSAPTEAATDAHAGKMELSGVTTQDVKSAAASDDMCSVDEQTLAQNVELILSELCIKSQLQEDVSGDDKSDQTPTMGNEDSQRKMLTSESKRSSLEPFSDLKCLSSSTPNNTTTASKTGPRIVKPALFATSNTSHHRSPSPESVSPEPKAIRGKRRFLTGSGRSLPSSSPRTPPRDVTASPIVAARSPTSVPREKSNLSTTTAARLANASPRPASPSTGQRRSITPEKPVGSPSAVKSRSITSLPSSVRSTPTTVPSPRPSGGKAMTPTLGSKSPHASPISNRRQQGKTPPSTSRQNSAGHSSASKSGVTVRKSPGSSEIQKQTADGKDTNCSADRPRPLVKEGTFTKEPSPTIHSVPLIEPLEVKVVPESTAGAADEKIAQKSQTVDSCSAAEASSSELPQIGHHTITCSDLSSTDDLSGNKAESGSETNAVILGRSQTRENSPARTVLKSRSGGSLGNLLSVKPTSKTNGKLAAALPGGRKSLDSNLFEAPAKKPARSKISSLWHREKSSTKTDTVGKTSDNLVKSDAVSTDPKKSRDGLGKSPKSFRKSFPMRKSKKHAEAKDITTDGDAGENQRLARSGTYDKLTVDTTVVQSPESTFSAPDDSEKTELEEVSTAASIHSMSTDALHTTRDDLDETVPNASNVAANASSGKVSKKLSIFRRFGSKESKSKSTGKETTQELGKAVGDESAAAVPQKKRGFSLFRKKGDRDQSSKDEEGSGTGGGVWVRHSEGRELVKSATLPANTSISLTASRNGGSPSDSQRKVPQSATTQSLISSAVGISSVDSVFPGVAQPSQLHMTKTEMLIARRRQSHGSGSTNSDEQLSRAGAGGGLATDSDADSHVTTNSASIVTTV